MKHDTHQLTAPEPKPDTKDDFKSLPLPEVGKKLGTSPDGLTQAEAEKRLSRYRPNGRIPARHAYNQ